MKFKTLQLGRYIFGIIMSFLIIASYHYKILFISCNSLYGSLFSYSYNLSHTFLCLFLTCTLCVCVCVSFIFYLFIFLGGLPICVLIFKGDGM